MDNRTVIAFINAMNIEYLIWRKELSTVGKSKEIWMTNVPLLSRCTEDECRTRLRQYRHVRTHAPKGVQMLGLKFIAHPHKYFRYRVHISNRGSCSKNFRDPFSYIPSRTRIDKKVLPGPGFEPLPLE